MSDYNQYEYASSEAADSVDNKSNEFLEDDITDSDLQKQDDTQIPQELINHSLLNDLSVTVVAQAGQVMLSVQQLLELSLDQVIDIAPLPPKVSLLVNGINIGDGYLVELNGRLGVKIARLNSNKQHVTD